MYYYITHIGFYIKGTIIHSYFLKENETDIQSTAETDLKLQQYILSS